MRICLIDRGAEGGIAHVGGIVAPHQGVENGVSVDTERLLTVLKFLEVDGARKKPIHDLGQLSRLVAVCFQSSGNALGTIGCHVHSQKTAEPRGIVSRGAGYQECGDEQKQDRERALSHTAPTALMVRNDDDPSSLENQKVTDSILSNLLCFVNSFFKKNHNILWFYGKVKHLIFENVV